MHQEQPGFTHWGSFAEYVGIHQADLNVVALPETMDFATAASLGCRFATSFRAVVDQGKVSAGQWVAVHGCGGVGLSAVMIANAMGANVIGVDLDPAKLELAKALGAVSAINGKGDVVEEIKEITKGGANVSLDALGHSATMTNSILCLRPRGKHIQVGLMLGGSISAHRTDAKDCGAGDRTTRVARNASPPLRTDAGHGGNREA